MEEDSTRRAWSRTHRLSVLAMGAASGLLVAATSIFVTAQRARQSLPPGAVARVGDRVISRSDYERQIQRLAADRRNPLTEEDRIFALDRLIDEELLIKRGLEIGLSQSASSVRRAIASAMISQIVTESAAMKPDRGELERFYQENRDFFTSPGRLRVRRIRVPFGKDPSAALAGARKARRELRAGAAFERVRDRLGVPSLVPLPDAFLPPAKLAGYLGPTLTKIAMRMDPGEVSAPVRSTGGYNVLVLVGREDPRPPPFDRVAAQVEVEFRRRAGDRALREYLDRLREREDVAVAPELTRPAEP